MSVTVHERPGVYASYDAMSAVSGGTAGKTVGVAAAAGGETDGAVLLHSYEEGAATFGAGSAMAEVLRVLYANGAGAVYAAAVRGGDYAPAFAALEEIGEIGVVVCDSTDAAVHAALRESVTAASEAQNERIGIVGAPGEESVSQALERAAALNCERMALVCAKGADGVSAAAALAGAVAASADPSLPLHGTALRAVGMAGRWSDAEIDSLVRGGVTPVETAGGVTSPVRTVTTRTKTDGAADTTWRELTTILIVDDVIPAVRTALRARFARSRNNAQTRGAIRSQVIVELEEKRARERIDSYGAVEVTAVESDPTACLVRFSFAVTHGLTRIYLTAHITV